MDFRNVKSITIPEGAVKKMSINGDVVWEKPAAYKNLVLTSTTDPGGTAIYNGVGYMDKMRWSSSGGAASVHADGRLTGWIPYKSGAVLRLKNFGLNRENGYVAGSYLVYYYTDGTIKTYSAGRQTTDAWTYTLPNNAAILYFRVSGYWRLLNNVAVDPPIVTLDEEIT